MVGTFEFWLWILAGVTAAVSLWPAWQRISFPSISIGDGPNITTVEVNDELIWQNMGMTFPGEAPTIKLVTGPVDGILGLTNTINGAIVVDVGEISLMPGVADADETALDRKITQTVAHEARHRWQLQTWGRFGLIWDKVAMTIGGVLLFNLATFPLLRQAVIWIGRVSHGPSTVVAIISLYLVWYLIFRQYLQRMARLVYVWCRSERDARQFAAKAAADPKWDDVVKVVRQHLIPHFPDMMRGVVEIKDLPVLTRR